MRHMQQKNRPSDGFFILYRQSYFASDSGITETVFLSPKPRLNVTMPAIFANSVWDVARNDTAAAGFFNTQTTSRGIASVGGCRTCFLMCHN